MTTETTQTDLIKEEVDQTFSMVWFVAILVAITSSVPAYLMKDTHPWYIAVPIILGVALCVVFEFLPSPITVKGRSLQVEPPRIEAFPRSFENFSRLSEIMVVELTKRGAKSKGKSAPDQLDLFKLSPDQNLRRLRVFQDAEGTKLIAMDCDRFVELLVSDLVETADKTLEASLLTTLKRYSGAALSEDQLFLISDKVARDLVKSDIRGNLLVHLTRNGETTIKKVLKQFHQSEAELGEAKIIMKGAKVQAGSEEESLFR